MALRNEDNRNDKSSLIARVLREVVRTESFETLADLSDALKTRLARLRIRWTNDELRGALRLVGSNTRLLAQSGHGVHVSRRGPTETPGPSREAAKALLAEWHVTVRT